MKPKTVSPECELCRPNAGPVPEFGRALSAGGDRVTAFGEK